MAKDSAGTEQGSFRGYTIGEGVKDGLPIGLGYLSVSFTFGILAVSKGLSWLQASIISLTNITSAGQVAGLGIMTAGGGILAMIISQIVINLRYSLMGIALSQKADKTMTPLLRILLAYGITDEIFDRIKGKSFPDSCTVSRDDLRYVHVRHYGFEGEVREGELIVNAAIAQDVIEIFQELYDINNL